MRYSNLSNNMMISGTVNNNYNSNTVVDGWAAHVTNTTWQSAPEHPPYQIMLDPFLIEHVVSDTVLSS
jgi:hypothetical protein